MSRNELVTAGMENARSKPRKVCVCLANAESSLGQRHRCLWYACLLCYKVTHHPQAVVSSPVSENPRYQDCSDSRGTQSRGAVCWPELPSPPAINSVNVCTFTIFWCLHPLQCVLGQLQGYPIGGPHIRQQP